MRSKKNLSQINNETRVFYVDNINGNDQNSGLSENEPLETLDAAFGNTLYAGNKVLLKSGGTYAGGVKLTANGTEEKPIVISSYGDGEKPVINDFDNDIGIKVYGEYVEISNLEFTAPKGVNGITCYALDGAVKGIKITDCDFHNINTGFNEIGYSSGGITLSATGVKPCWFEDAVIENNTFDTVARTAVNLDTNWCAKDKNQEWGSNNIVVNGNGERDSANSPVYYSKNITVRGNEIKNNGGDAILLIGAEDSLVEYNRVEDSGLFRNVEVKNYWASIWLRDCKDTIVQYNAVYGNRDKNGGIDLQAYDSDIGCRDCIFQYNYSQDNAGGFMLLCSGVKDNNARNDGTIVRYNLSVNDGYDLDSKNSKQVIDVVDNVQNAQIYNNTIYSSKKDVVLVQFADYGTTGDTKIPPVDNILTNNIFYVEEGVTNTAFRMWDTEDATATLNNNLFYGVDIPEISGITVENSVKADPALDSDYRPATDLFGVAIENNGGKDYNGNDLSGKNIIGALLAVK